MKYIKLTDTIRAAMQTKFTEIMAGLTVIENDVTVKVSTKDMIDTTDVVFPTVYIEEQASNKLWCYINLCDKEIGWHGTVVREEGNVFRITDVFLFPQTVTAATVTTDDDEYSTWLLSQPDETFNQMRFHGHSHVNMNTGASGTDLAYQQNLLRDVQDFYIFGIFNKRGDINLCIYDMQTNFLYEKEDIEVYDYCTQYETDIATDIKEYVKTPVSQVRPPAGSGYSYSYGDYQRQNQQDKDDKDTEDKWREKYYQQKFEDIYGY